MTEGIREKLDRMAESLDNFEEGKTLPISIGDIQFIIGACNHLLSSVERHEQTYKRDVMEVGVDRDKFRDKWKEARQISTRLGNERMALLQVLNQARLVWIKPKALKSAIASYDTRSKTFHKADSVSENILIP
jgi:hypothetical protein